MKTRVIDHVHIFNDFIFDVRVMSKIYCYQHDCYRQDETGVPVIDKSLYPPEKIGPKLVVKP